MPQHQPLPFLKQVARYYLEQGNITKRTFVFPSKRALRFFEHYLKELVRSGENTQPIFAPKLTTINDFILGLKPEMAVLDKTELLFSLYECYISHQGQAAEHSLESFLFWGNIILSDFDLIDRHLVDAKQLYSNLEGYKGLEDIHLDFLGEQSKDYLALYFKGFVNPSKRSEEDKESYRRSFLQFWESLYPLYLDFREKCGTQTYEGCIYRHIAEGAAELAAELRDKHLRLIDEGISPYVFVGLFELSQSELRLLKYLRVQRVAEFCWDRQLQVLQDKKHPVSRLLEKNMSVLGAVEGFQELNYEENNYLPHEVTVYNCASTVTQVKAIPSILRDLNKLPSSELGSRESEEDPLDTAIILPSEELLIPTVSSIPSEYKALNITLGYPLNRTSVSTLISRWLRLLPEGYNGHYAVGSIVSLLSLQLLTEFYPGLHTLIHALRKQKHFALGGKWIVQTYLPHLVEREAQRGAPDKSQALADCTALLEILLMPESDALRFLRQLDTLLDMLAEPMMRRDEAENADEFATADEAEGEKKSFKINFDLNFLMHYQKLVRRLHDLLQRGSYEGTDREVAVQLLEGLSRNKTIPFKGDPLKGLQVMGLLESRSLHFPKLIYLSAQEGKLPKRKQQSSFIPHILRMGHGLPLPQQDDIVESYRFYQTIAHCEKLMLFVCQDDALGGKGEESRYIAQLEKLYGIPIKRIAVELPPKPRTKKEVTLDKHRPEIVDALSSWLSDSKESPNEEQRRLSASSLNTYLQCPLKFYYQYIGGLRSSDEQSQLLSGGEFGDILHKTFSDKLYKVPKGRSIDSEYIQKLLDNPSYIESCVREVYEQYRSDKLIKHEIQSLDEHFVQLITANILPILEYDKANSPFTYLYSEAEVYHEMPIQCAGQERYVCFKGYIDRIDLKVEDGRECVRILDYKTGSDKKKPLDDWERVFANSSDYKAQLQTLLYCEMLTKGQIVETQRPFEHREKPMLPGLLITKEMHKGQSYSPYFELDKTTLVYHDAQEMYISYLRSKLEELFDLNRPFTQTTDSKVCTYCPAKNICHR